MEKRSLWKMLIRELIKYSVDTGLLMVQISWQGGGGSEAKARAVIK